MKLINIFLVFLVFVMILRFTSCSKNPWHFMYFSYLITMERDRSRAE